MRKAEKLNKKALEIGLYVYESGESGVYELRYVTSNDIAGRADTLNELEEVLESIKERLSFEERNSI